MRHTTSSLVGFETYEHPGAKSTGLDSDELLARKSLWMNRGEWISIFWAHKLQEYLAKAKERRFLVTNWNQLIYFRFKNPPTFPAKSASTHFFERVLKMEGEIYKTEFPIATQRVQSRIQMWLGEQRRVSAQYFLHVLLFAGLKKQVQKCIQWGLNPRVHTYSAS